MILIVDCGSNKVPFIENAVDEFMDYRTIPLLDLDSSDFTDVSGVIISGAPILLTELDPTPYLQKMTWLETTTLPVLGICFGHQLIGLHFGAQINRIKADRDWQTIEIYEDCSLVDRLPNEFEMMEDHCETISIPGGFQLVGSSDACINEIMQHRERPIYGVQFHPEVSGNHGRVIFDNFIRLCSPQN